MTVFEDVYCVFCKFSLVHVVMEDKLFYCRCDNCGSSGPLETTKIKAMNRWIKGTYIDASKEKNKVLQNIEVNEKSYLEQKIYYESKLKDLNSVINRKYKGSQNDTN